MKTKNETIVMIKMAAAAAAAASARSRCQMERDAYAVGPFVFFSASSDI